MTYPIRRANPYGGNIAIAGVGKTDFTRESGRSVLELAGRASRAALVDAGLDRNDIDGIISFSWSGDSVAPQAVASVLQIRELHYAVEMSLGGQAPSLAVLQAAAVIEAGLATRVLVYRALNGRSESRVGSRLVDAPTSQYRYPIGLTAYPQYIALWARRLMIETGASEADLAAVVLAQREHASRNDQAVRRTPIATTDYFAEPYVVEPFRAPDCTIEVDGACAAVVTSLDEARGLRQPPAVLRGGAWLTGAHPGLDGGDILQWPDMSRNFTHYLAERLWESARMTPRDVRLAEIYDCFSSTVLFGLEGLGLVGRGEAGAFVADGETALHGRLPVNTNGGLLSEGYLQGMNTLIEAVLQVQGRCGARQVPDAHTAVVTSGALTDGSALILCKDGV